MSKRTEIQKKMAVDSTANGHKDIRPGEVVIVSTQKVLIADMALGTPGTTELLAYTVEVDEPTIIPARLLTQRGSDAETLERDGIIRIVADAQRGKLPDVLDIRDHAQVGTWRDGHPPVTNRQQRIDSWQSILIDRSLSECVTDAIAAGVPEDIALDRLIEQFDLAWENQRASERPWIAAAQRLIEEYRGGTGTEQS